MHTITFYYFLYQFTERLLFTDITRGDLRGSACGLRQPILFALSRLVSKPTAEQIGSAFSSMTRWSNGNGCQIVYFKVSRSNVLVNGRPIPRPYISEQSTCEGGSNEESRCSSDSYTAILIICIKLVFLHSIIYRPK